MSISSLAASTTAFRIPQPQPTPQSSPARQSGGVQGTSRAQNHQGGSQGANLVTASSAQTSSRQQNGSLLDVLI